MCVSTGSGTTMALVSDLVGDGDEFERDGNNDGELGVPSSLALINADAPGPSTLVRQDADGMSSRAAPSAFSGEEYVEMGFPKEMVLRGIKEIGEWDANRLLSLLLAYMPGDDSVGNCSTSRRIPQRVEDGEEEDDDFDFKDWEDDVDAGALCPNSDGSGCEDFLPEMTQGDKQIKSLVDMGFPEHEANMALTRCGVDSPIDVLVDSIHASQANHEVTEENCFGSCVGIKKARLMDDSKKRRKIYGGGAHGNEPRLDGGHEESMPLPSPMVGFGLPGDRPRSVDRRLPTHSVGAPFFYYENVALPPRGVWEAISRFLSGIEAEFVDSKLFCAASRKRGYIHNLPMDGRFPLLPLPPKTIFDAFPRYKDWWPSWDPRRQLDFSQTCDGSAKLAERIVRALANSSNPPPQSVQQYVLKECMKSNLVWVGKNKVAPLEPDEMELLLGYPRDHTRGASKADRYKCLRSSFQVDTVAYHLSVLKDRFPRGMNVLSLFSGIGGAEIALHRLGIHMKTLVSVENSEANRNILRTWWNQTQKGKLIEIHEVRSLTEHRIASVVRELGGFDLVIGGVPCSNLPRSVGHSRVGLEGDQSTLFHDYVRILNAVKSSMSRM